MAYVYDGELVTVQAATTAWLAFVQTQIVGQLSASGSAVYALAQDLPLLAAAAPDNTVGYAAALATLLQDYVAAIVADAASAAAPDPTAPSGYEDWSRLPPLAADPSYGLAALATIGATLAPAVATVATGQAAANWTALAQLVGGSATAALLMLYAQTSFVTSAQADAARSQVYALVVAQIEAAAGNDPLVANWRAALAAAVTLLTAAATQAATLETMSFNAPLPAVVLAQRLYQDGTQADALVQLNAAPHPLFMPLSVEYLAA